MASEKVPPLLRTRSSFLGFEMVSAGGGLRRDRRVVPGGGTAVLTAQALRFHGERLDQQVAIPLGDIRGVALSPRHNGRRWWSGRVLKVSFGGGDTRVLGLHMGSGDAAAWHHLLGQLIAG